MFIEALKESRLGLCSPECYSFLSALSRDLSAQRAGNVSHIFFKRVPAILFNRSVGDTFSGIVRG